MSRLMRQLGGSPKPLAIAAGAAAVLALLPGLPTLPFLALAGLAGGGGVAALQESAGGARPTPRQRPPSPPNRRSARRCAST